MLGAVRVFHNAQAGPVEVQQRLRGLFKNVCGKFGGAGTEVGDVSAGELGVCNTWLLRRRHSEGVNWVWVEYREMEVETALF